MAARRSTFARRLRALREAEGVSAAELARLAGVSEPDLADLEAGNRVPGWDTVCRLARALKVEVNAFHDGPSAAGDPLHAIAPRLWKAARAYAQAYDLLEKKSRGGGDNVQAFMLFQEAQVELNMAALDQFAGQQPGRRGRNSAARKR
jgi:transcriptional regulator with XRE-family HTH domain